MSATEDPRFDEYHLAQWDEPYRSTIALTEFMRGRVAEATSFLDVACGAGANIAHLRGELGGEWTGIDISARCIEEAARRLPGTELLLGDMNELGLLLGGRAFDVVLSIQTLSWVPSYERPLAELLGALRPGGTLFVTSLFTEGRVDADIVVRELDGVVAYYNVYALSRFAEECAKRHSTIVAAEEFVIDVDLPKPAHGRMGTFTRRLEDGRRLQFSGPLLMPWMFLAVRREHPAS